MICMLVSVVQSLLMVSLSCLKVILHTKSFKKWYRMQPELMVSFSINHAWSTKYQNGTCASVIFKVFCPIPTDFYTHLRVRRSHFVRMTVASDLPTQMK